MRNDLNQFEVPPIKSFEGKLRLEKSDLDAVLAQFREIVGDLGSREGRVSVGDKLSPVENDCR